MKPLQAINTLASGQSILEGVRQDDPSVSRRNRSRRNGTCEHRVAPAHSIKVVERALQGTASAVVDSGSSPGRKKKRKTVKAVASHTGKFCDTATMLSLVAAAANAAESAVYNTTGAHVQEEATLDDTVRKRNNKIQGKGGRCSVSRLTVEKRKLQYDSGPEVEDDDHCGSLVAALGQQAHKTCAARVTNSRSVQIDGKAGEKRRKHAKQKK